VGESEEIGDLAVVGALQCTTVQRTQLIRLQLESDSPPECIKTEVHYKKIGGNPAVTPVAVWERMYGNQAMMEPHREFVGFVRAVLNPSLGIID
jgi:hypothetical protein